MTYVFAPITLVFLGGAAFIGWKLDAERHGEVRRQLDIRDALAAESRTFEAVTGVSIVSPPDQA